MESLIKLGSPSLRKQLCEYNEYEYDIKYSIYLPLVEKIFSADLFDTCLSRRTIREFKKLEITDISNLYWHTIKTISQVHSGPRWKHKAVISAGGKHSIDIIHITSIASERWSCYLYNDNAHALSLLKVEQKKIDNFIENINRDMLDIQDGDLIWFISQDARASSKYQDSESLIWRDAGVILGLFSLVAEALQLNFCPLGITGEPDILNFFNNHNGLSGLGGAVLGRKHL